MLEGRIHSPHQPTIFPFTLSSHSPSSSPLSSHSLIFSSLHTQTHNPHRFRAGFFAEMAALSPATLPAAALISGSSRNASVRRKAGTGVAYIEGLNSFGGLKAHNRIASLGVPRCTTQSFAMVVNSMKASARGGKKGRGGGALSSTCNAAAEIFKIAAIMNGLVLVGVAVGFVLLRIEATVEESE